MFNGLSSISVVELLTISEIISCELVRPEEQVVRVDDPKKYVEYVFIIWLMLANQALSFVK